MNAERQTHAEYLRRYFEVKDAGQPSNLTREGFASELKGRWADVAYSKGHEDATAEASATIANLVSQLVAAQERLAEAGILVDIDIPRAPGERAAAGGFGV